MSRISHNRALRIINNHGWSPTDQTATINGEWVAEGTSFYEMLGQRESYKARDIWQWLGY